MSFQWLLSKISPFRHGIDPSLPATQSSQFSIIGTPTAWTRMTWWLSTTPRQQPTPRDTGQKRGHSIADGLESSPLGHKPSKVAKTAFSGVGASLESEDLTVHSLKHDGIPDPCLLEQEKPHEIPNETSLAGWNTADIALRRKIRTRGDEPLLPMDWKCDFRILPFSFFTTRSARAYIKPCGRSNIHKSAFRGSKALEKLFEIGPIARDDLMCGVEPHGKIGRAFQNFVKWTNDDALLSGRKGILPIIKINTASTHAALKTSQHQLLNDLRHLDMQWRRARPAKTNMGNFSLYGVIVRHTVWAVFSYVPDGQPGFDKNTADAYLRTIGAFNFADGDYDVWNGLAFAIIAVHARNLLMESIESGMLPTYDGTTLGQTSDEDL